MCETVTGNICVTTEIHVKLILPDLCTTAASMKCVDDFFSCKMDSSRMKCSQQSLSTNICMGWDLNVGYGSQKSFTVRNSGLSGGINANGKSVRPVPFL